MNFLFWNIKKNTSEDFLNKISELREEQKIDVLMLAELPEEDIEVVENKLKTQTENKFRRIGGLVFKKVVIFASNDIQISPFDETGKRIGAFKIKSDVLDKEVLLFVIHFYDKRNTPSDEQNEKIPLIKEYIEEVEKRQGDNEHSSICGDFNMNPFETSMIKAGGMHAVMDKQIAEKGTRTVEGRKYTFFYNPMWGFLGDNGKGDVSGTYYYRSSNHIEYFWHLLDQILLRKGLLEYLNDCELKIVTTIKGENLLKKDGTIKTEGLSDHLPIKFCLTI